MKYLLSFILCFGADLAGKRLWKSMYLVELAHCTNPPSVIMVPVPMPQKGSGA